MSLILAAAILAQTPSANEALRGDLEFTRAVEESVASIPGADVPDGYRGLIGLLGADSWRGREAATTRLESALRGRPEDRRWLFRMRMSSDLEVRSRANSILRRLHPCATCKATGRSKNTELLPCYDCQGTATAWPWSIWD
jgi:hypothetical protein